MSFPRCRVPCVSPSGVYIEIMPGTKLFLR